MTSGLPKGAYRLPTGGYVLPDQKVGAGEVVVRGRVREHIDHEAAGRLFFRMALEDIIEHERVKKPGCSCAEFCRRPNQKKAA